MGDRVTVVKLGGSIISDKKVDFSYRGESVVALAETIASSRENVVLVHGGGAFGHAVAKRFHLSSSNPTRSAEGVAETRQAMLDLNARVCGSLLEGGVRPYTFSPFQLFTASGAKGTAWLRKILRDGLTPVTFGDVVRSNAGFMIVSGDTISLKLSQSLRAARCIFVMDVAGIMGPDGTLIGSLGRSEVPRLKSLASQDTTGGIALKVREALKMAASGTEVAFVSGFRPKEFYKALKRLSFHGTIVRVPSRDQD